MLRIALVWTVSGEEWEQLAEFAACPALGDAVRFEIEHGSAGSPYDDGAKLAGTVVKVTHQSKRYSRSDAIDVQLDLVDVDELEED